MTFLRLVLLFMGVCPVCSFLLRNLNLAYLFMTVNDILMYFCGILLFIMVKNKFFKIKFK